MEPETGPGGVQLPTHDPFKPKVVVPDKTERNGALVVTVRYCLGDPPPEQVLGQGASIRVPVTHSQKSEAEAVAPVMPLAFWAVVWMAV